MDATRRQFLRGQRCLPTPLRPPWALAEAAFTSGCSRCQACVDACPPGILVSGSGGFPQIDFNRGECTFCASCVDVCPDPVFTDPATTDPWDHIARFGTDCLGHRQIYCRSCGDACQTDAIRFAPRYQSMSTPDLNGERCTGCGACVSACPVNAIGVHPRGTPTPEAE